MHTIIYQHHGEPRECHQVQGLGKTVNDGEDCVFPIRVGETSDKVQSYMGPGVLRNRKGGWSSPGVGVLIVSFWVQVVQACMKVVTSALMEGHQKARRVREEVRAVPGWPARVEECAHHWRT